MLKALTFTTKSLSNEQIDDILIKIELTAIGSNEKFTHSIQLADK